MAEAADAGGAADGPGRALQVDIAVAGGGVTGAALALALANAGWQVALVEQAPPRSLTGAAGIDLRVSALSPGSCTFLTALGVPAEALGHSYRGMHVEAADDTGCVDFDAAEGLGAIAENGRLTAALWGLLETHADVHMLCPQAVAEVRAGIVTDAGVHVAASLVVGADGAASQVRELSGARMQGAAVDQRALVTIVSVERGDAQIAWQRFAETGPLAFLPLGVDAAGQPQFSIVWSAPPEMVAALADCAPGVFCQRLAAASGGAFGAVLSVDRRVSFPLAQRFAPTHVAAPGVVLVGDAAHVVHPLAGQGANMGLRDVATLVEVLRGARSAGCELDDPGFLREYERRRAADNLAMLAGIAAMPTVWTGGGVLRWLRSTGLAVLRGSAATRRRLTAAATR